MEQDGDLGEGLVEGAARGERAVAARENGGAQRVHRGRAQQGLNYGQAGPGGCVRVNVQTVLRGVQAAAASKLDFGVGLARPV